MIRCVLVSPRKTGCVRSRLSQLDALHLRLKPRARRRAWCRWRPLLRRVPERSAPARAAGRVAPHATQRSPPRCSAGCTPNDTVRPDVLVIFHSDHVLFRREVAPGRVLRRATVRAMAVIQAKQLLCPTEAAIPQHLISSRAVLAGPRTGNVVLTHKGRSFAKRISCGELISAAVAAQPRRGVAGRCSAALRSQGEQSAAPSGEEER